MDYKHICNIGILNLVACRADQSEHLQFENKLGHVNPIFGLITNMQKNRFKFHLSKKLPD